jgi:cytochrome P450
MVEAITPDQVHAELADWATTLGCIGASVECGIHHCVGAPLGRIEVRTVLTVLLERANSITLDPEHAPRWVNSLMVRRHEELSVRLVSR